MPARATPDGRPRGAGASVDARTCPSCAATRDRSLWRAAGHDVRRCRACGHVFDAAHAQDPGQYDAAYFRDHYAPRADALRAFFAQELARLGSPPPGGRVLDVGSGMGLFLQQAKRAGWSVRGVDVSAAACREAVAGGLDEAEVHHGALADLDEPEGSFDLVTFWDSLAHIPHLHGDLVRARRLLRPGGRLLVKTPHRPARTFRLVRALTLPRPAFGASLLHLRTQTHHFTPRTLSRALAEAGLREVDRRWSREVTPDAPRPRSFHALAAAAARGLVAACNRHPSLLMAATPVEDP